MITPMYKRLLCLALLMSLFQGNAEGSLPLSIQYRLSASAYRLNDRWNRPVLERVRKLEHEVDQLLQRYPNDPFLLQLKGGLLINQQRYNDAQKVLITLLPQTVGKSNEIDVRHWLFHLYWRAGEYHRAWAQIQPPLNWAWEHFSGVTGGFLVMLLTWILARRTGDNVPFLCALTAFLLDLSFPLYSIVLGWVISGAPFPVQSFHWALSQVIYRTLSWATILMAVWVIRRRLPRDMQPLPHKPRLYIGIGAGVVLGVVVVYWSSVWIVGHINWAKLTLENMSYLFAFDMVMSMSLGATALSGFYTVVCYRAARKSFGLYGAIVWSLLLNLSGELPWMRSLDDLYMIGNIVTWHLLSIAFYEWEPSWASAAVPYIVKALLKSAQEGLEGIGQL